MIAGLLGEQLASPRTASKTNQQPALETKPTDGGESSNKDDFASFVSKEPQPTRNEPRKTEAQDSATSIQTAENSLAAQSFTQPSDINIQSSAESESNDATSLLNAATPASSDAVEPELKTIAVEPKFATGEAVNSNPAGTEEVSLLAEETPRSGEAASKDQRAQARPDTSELQSPKATQASSTTAEAGPRMDGESQAPNPLRSQQFVGDDVGRQPTEFTASRNQPNLESAEIRQADTPPRITRIDATAAETISALQGSRDAPVVSGEPSVSFASASTSSSAPVQTPAGMTPTAPSIPVAAPNELSNIILNALRNGVEPQEQLMVQLDPPELGRVTIDFKFDAQGLQQIVVTSENPEALKRLREMHFELTEALREHGLSEKNMSFQQQTEQRPQTGGGSTDFSRHEDIFAAAGNDRAAPMTAPASARSPGTERLDLLL